MAAAATLLILPFGVAAALALARYRGPGKGGDRDALSPCRSCSRPRRWACCCSSSWGGAAPLGAWLARHGLEIVFTWKAVLLATAVMSFPLLVRSARTAFEEVDPRLVGLARTLGCSAGAAFFRVTLPLAWRGVLAGTSCWPSRGPSASSARR